MTCWQEGQGRGHVASEEGIPKKAGALGPQRQKVPKQRSGRPRHREAVGDGSTGNPGKQTVKGLGEGATW